MPRQKPVVKCRWFQEVMSKPYLNRSAALPTISAVKEKGPQPPPFLSLCIHASYFITAVVLVMTYLPPGDWGCQIQSAFVLPGGVWDCYWWV